MSGGSQFKVNGETHYQRNRQEYIDKAKNRKTELSKLIREIKENQPCLDCGQFFPYYIMDFDHLHDKEHEISKMIHNGRSLKSIMKEIEKCELVCSNCHRTRTFKRMQD